MTRMCVPAAEFKRGKGFVTEARSSLGGCRGSQFDASSSLLSQNSFISAWVNKHSEQIRARIILPLYWRNVQKEYTNRSVSPDKDNKDNSHRWWENSGKDKVNVFSHCGDTLRETLRANVTSHHLCIFSIFFYDFHYYAFVVVFFVWDSIFKKLSGWFFLPYEHVLFCVLCLYPGSLGLLFWWHIPLCSAAGVGLPSMPLSTFLTWFWWTLRSRLLFSLLLLLLLWNLGRRKKKRAKEQHSNNDKVDTLPVVPKHTSLNFYGPPNEYLWTKCNFKTPKTLHNTLYHPKSPPPKKINQLYSHLDTLTPCYTKSAFHLCSSHQTNTVINVDSFYLLILNLQDILLPGFHLSWCMLCGKPANNNWKRWFGSLLNNQIRSLNWHRTHPLQKLSA